MHEGTSLGSDWTQAGQGKFQNGEHVAGDIETHVTHGGLFIRGHLHRVSETRWVIESATPGQGGNQYRVSVSEWGWQVVTVSELLKHEGIRIGGG